MTEALVPYFEKEIMQIDSLHRDMRSALITDQIFILWRPHTSVGALARTGTSICIHPPASTHTRREGIKHRAPKLYYGGISSILRCRASTAHSAGSLNRVHTESLQLSHFGFHFSFPSRVLFRLSLAPVSRPPLALSRLMENSCKFFHSVRSR